MGYQVLARKWRPGRFSELVGQEHVVTAITNALDNNRLHHAYLFTGTRGVGKTTIARIFSKSLNCEQGQSATPCGECGTCVEIEQGNYVDLLEIDAASRTKVEDTRELLDNVQYKPSRGRFKVYLIDEVHMLSKHSFNALLKTLEEPPPHVKFLLATTDPQKLPITILSRCLQFNLKALSRDQITQQLEHVLSAENIEHEPAALALLARAAQGSMRDALSLTDQAIAQGGNKVLAAIVTDMLGLMDRHQLLKLLNAIATRNAELALQIVAEMAEQAPDFSGVLAELSSYLHQIALTQWVPEACKLETTSARAIYQLAKKIPAEHTQLLYQMALQGRKEMPYAADGRSALEMTILRMLTFAPVAPVDNAIDVISDYKPQQQSGSQASDKEQTPAITNALSQQDTEVSASQTDYSESAPDYDEQPVQSAEDDQGAAHLYDELHDIEQQAQEYREQSAPGEITPQPQQAVQPEESLSEVQDMLALRQRLKRRKEEAPQPEEKKSQDETDDFATRIKNSRAQSPAASVQTHSSEPKEENNTPAQVSTANSTYTEPDDQQPPPWVTESTEDFSEQFSPDAVEPARTVDEQAVETKPEEESEPVRDAAQERSQYMRSAAPQTVESTPPALVKPASPPMRNTMPSGEYQAYLENGEKLVHAQQVDKWSAIVESMPVAGLLKQIALHSVFTQEANTVTLELDPSQEHLLNESTREQLQQALSEVLEQSVTLNVQLGKPENTPYQIQQKINQMRYQHAKFVVEQDDAIQSIISTFSAEVQADSIQPR